MANNEQELAYNQMDSPAVSQPNSPQTNAAAPANGSDNKQPASKAGATKTVQVQPLKVARKNSMESMDKEREVSASKSHDHYLARIKDVHDHVKHKQEEVQKDKKKELLLGPAVVWYLAHRYQACEDFTWGQWFRHFVPYPLVTLCAAAIQVISLTLLSVAVERPAEIKDKDEFVLVQARIMAIVILTSYILMTGKNIRDFIHCIAFDAIFQERPCLYGYILLPIGQGMIEAAALYISALIILQSDDVADVFKDAVAVMFILEVDQWFGGALNMLDLGLDADSLVIDFTNDDSNLDELIVTIVYGGLLVLRLGIIVWCVYTQILGTFWENNGY